jgi:hypothetical protein
VTGLDVAQLADRDSPLVQAGLARYCKICHRAPQFDCVSPIDNGPLVGRVIHIERATREGKTP